MEIRPARVQDLDALIEIDGTIDSSHYLHVERNGQGVAVQWRLEERPLREKRIIRNRPTDDIQFLLKQIAAGIEDGLALLAEHEGVMVAQMVAQPRAPLGTMEIIDLRVDSDHRREGLATAMLYQVIADARQKELRAVAAACRTDNMAAARLLAKSGFDLAGIDTQRHTNHDLVKESATLFWYAALD